MIVYALVILLGTGQQTTLGLYSTKQTCARAATVYDIDKIPGSFSMRRAIKVQP